MLKLKKPEPSSLGEADTVTGIQWHRVLRRHQAWLRTVVVARLGDASAVEDVMQDVAAAAIKNGYRLRDRSKVAPWLYRLAVVASLQHRRRLGRRRKLINRHALRRQPTEVDTRADPLTWLLAEEQRELVRAALQKMHTRDAEMLLLKYTQDWTYRQIAEHLGVSASSVESRLHRARQKLRALLAPGERSVKSVTS